VRRAIGLAVACLALAAPAQAAAPSRLLVEATEFRFTLSRATVKPGPAIVQLAIRGEDPHDLKLRRLGTARAQISGVNETLPGGVAEWRGKLTKGKWELYCSLEGHKKLGMRAVLTVK
jgi:plastocyanin